MSRRRAAKKRSILPDPKFGDELIGKFINHVMREGKKSIAARIVYTALDIIAEKMSKTHDKDKKPVSGSVALTFFKEALENLYPVVAAYKHLHSLQKRSFPLFRRKGNLLTSPP